jgi:hypothetical protein
MAFYKESLHFQRQILIIILVLAPFVKKGSSGEEIINQTGIGIMSP